MPPVRDLNVAGSRDPDPDADYGRERAGWQPGDPVVVVTPTVMDGTVVRWYRDLYAYDNGREYLSASRKGVRVNIFLHDVPAGDMAAAQRTYEALKANPDADMKSLATHRGSGLVGPLVEVDRA